jgi:hypothetical protein
MRFRRASLALGLLTVVGLCVVGAASSAGTQRVTARTTFVAGSTTCTAPAPKAQNLTVEHCTGGVEMWEGDITGTGRYSFNRVKNLSSGTAVLTNGVEIIEGACVLDTCGGDLYSKWHEHDQESGSFLIEQSFHGGTGPFTRAHGSIRIVDLDLSEYTGQLGF